MCRSKTRANVSWLVSLHSNFRTKSRRTRSQQWGHGDDHNPGRAEPTITVYVDIDRDIVGTSLAAANALYLVVSIVAALSNRRLQRSPYIEPERQGGELTEIVCMPIIVFVWFSPHYHLLKEYHERSPLLNSNCVLLVLTAIYSRLDRQTPPQ
jgi:hypothetical protein